MRLLADAMLGKLVKWLRLSGARVAYTREEDDEKIIKRALREKAVLLTRDQALALKARGYARVVLIKSNSPEEQLKRVARELKIKLKPSETLCAHCGSRLKRVSRKKVEGKMFPRVFRSHKVFWKCIGCGQIYWKGSHWKRITRAIKKAGS